jgi:energy-coupling factor transport system permease protein
MGAMAVSSLYWFRAFRAIMTSDKLMYVLGGLSPRISLIFSMALRYVSLLSTQHKKIKQSATVLGLYKEDSIVSSVKGNIRVMSALTGWALENGIVTSDSMNARGYGVGKRSNFHLYSFKVKDALLLGASVALIILFLLCVSMGGGGYGFYPNIHIELLGTSSVVGYTAYGILAFLPTFIEIGGEIKWRYLRSKI